MYTVQGSVEKLSTDLYLIILGLVYVAYSGMPP